MERSQLNETNTYKMVGIAAVAVLTSAITAVGVLLMVRWHRGKRQDGDDKVQVEQIPTQPAVDSSMPAQAPDHFIEQMVAPGLTYTSAEVAQQDEEDGRSSEEA